MSSIATVAPEFAKHLLHTAVKTGAFGRLVGRAERRLANVDTGNLESLWAGGEGDQKLTHLTGVTDPQPVALHLAVIGLEFMKRLLRRVTQHHQACNPFPGENRVSACSGRAAGRLLFLAAGDRRCFWSCLSRSANS